MHDRTSLQGGHGAAVVHNASATAAGAAKDETREPPVVVARRSSQQHDPDADHDAAHGHGHGHALSAPLSRVRSLVPDVGARPACFRNTLQEVSFVAQATIAMSASAFLVGASSIVTASIGADLHMTQSQIVWMSAAPTLTAGGFQLALGQLSDLLGRRAVYLAGMGSFAVFVLLVGFARNSFWMDLVLGVLGVCCAMIVPPAGGILGQAYEKPSKRKNLAFAAFSAGNPLGFVMGSITCGIATRIFNWRASFFFIAILWAVFFLHALWAVPKVEAYTPGQPLSKRLELFVRTFDWLGAVLTLFGTGMMSAGITLGPTDGWSSPVTLCLLIMGILLICVFIVWETKCVNPMMPPFIWKDKNFSLIMLVIGTGFMSFQATSFYLAYFMQEIRHWDALNIAVHLLPQVVAGLIWNVLIGHILHKVNNSLLMAAGSLSFLVANLLLSFMEAHSSYWAFIFPALILNVVGADFQFNVANMYVMQSLPPHQQGLASGIMTTLVRLSSTVALGIATAVYTSIDSSAQGQAQPMLKFTRTFQVSVALAAVGCLFVLFMRVGTQGGYKEEEKESGGDSGGDSGVTLGARPAESGSGSGSGLGGDEKGLNSGGNLQKVYVDEEVAVAVPEK
ncbi:major facilitator superfamily-domain-containing protein [Coniella lustricola]|uniref:Major facilitator superfamily-domain-containing protein n=1 Tax=Coniella lustricola TaxID=2025994 RepID=A0A2T3AL07_9PEZI|nr:major facilitator superfamily-domain-containing protein [Coniella lustricola]